MDSKAQEFRHHYRQNIIPRSYSGVIHILTNFSLLIGMMILSLVTVEQFHWRDLFFIPVMLLVGNLVVYTLHRYPLHHRWRFFPYAYKAHTLWHHAFFTHEEITFDSRRDLHVVFFPKMVVSSFTLLFALPLYFILPLFMPLDMAMSLVFMACFYFLLYEIHHFASHLPLDHWWLKWPGFRYMREFHRHHHNPRLMARYNFGIVMPLGDQIFGTQYCDPSLAESEKLKK